MDMRARLIAAVVSTALSVTSASATVIISADSGGKMQDYTTRFRQVRDSGEPVVIAGKCVSACTMVLGLVPSDRICATQNAVLGFHAAWMFDNSGKRVVSASGTEDLMQTYPAAVRAWIARHGGLTLKMMYLRGRDLAAIVAPCNSSRVASASHAKRFGGVYQVGDTNTPRASSDARR
ncbi:MAG TPA: hypothetical protein DEA80_08675 [Afipia sp.]|nr:hypothetical protein [Afipia sp.]OUX59203.1 MAG: hypothetical protein CBB64_21225 [Afipia sp. TMED4]HAO43273.1 hypothetical protein [Afipia sp.]HAQ93065.1 hypothetical protein [Afipia sp.]HBR44987.1 hypothetical protein [Afipia sp.]